MELERTAKSKSHARPPATATKEQIRWKKERKRRKRRSHNPRSVPRHCSELKEALTIAKDNWKQATFGNAC